MTDLTGTRQQINLASMGVRFNSPIPGFTFPTVVGPFNQVDLRARLSQTLLDLTAWNNYRASAETRPRDRAVGAGRARTRDLRRGRRLPAGRRRACARDGRTGATGDGERAVPADRPAPQRRSRRSSRRRPQPGAGADAATAAHLAPERFCEAEDQSGADGRPAADRSVRDRRRHPVCAGSRACGSTTRCRRLRKAAPI